MENGARLAAYRKKNGLTQQQLGEELNVSAQAVSKWENDQSEPDIATICKLAELYHVSVGDLLGVQDGGETAPEGAAPTPKKKKGPSPVLVFLKKYWILLAVIVGAVAMVLAGVLIVLHIWRTNEPARMMEGFEQIELGMTKDEVQAIMGEPEGTASSVFEEKGDKFTDMWDEAELLLEYGHLDCTFWYYRDYQYEKNQKLAEKEEKAAEDDDWDGETYEYPAYNQIRFTFDAEGVLIEAYYNTSYTSGIWNDYGVGDKSVETLTFLGQAPKINGTLPTSKSAVAEIIFEDGSIYLGEIDLKESEESFRGPDGTRSATGVTPWGESDVYLQKKETSR